MTIAEYLASILLISVACQWLAWRFKVPSLLLLLIAGFTLGQFFQGDAMLTPSVLLAGVNISVGIILFEGALTLEFRKVRDLGRPLVQLCVVVPVLAWVLITAAGVFVGLDIRLALLVGAILIVTGPTVIGPILRQLRPTRRVSQLLLWEGIVVDPIGAILAVFVYTGIVSIGGNGALVNALAALGKAAGIACLIAFTVGPLLAWVLRRRMVPDFLQGVLFLAVAVGSMVASNHVQRESGLLTVTLLGIFLANAKGLHLGGIKQFKEHLQVLLVGALFVILAGRVGLHQLVAVAPQAIPFALILMLIVRPVSVWLGLMRSGVTREERTLVMGMAPRGIVAAAVTSIFALEFEHAAGDALNASLSAPPEKAAALVKRTQELYALAAQAEDLVPLVFILIVMSVATYGLGVGRFAERLGLAKKSPQGVIMAGNAPWVSTAASRLMELGVPVLVVSNDPSSVRVAQAAGVPTMRAAILSEHVLDELDFAGMNTFVGATNDDSTNSIAAYQFGHILGSAQAFQLRRQDSTDTGSKERRRRMSTSKNLTAPVAFDPPLDYDELIERSKSMRISLTKLTPKFPLSEFRQRNPEAVLLFVQRGDSLDVVRAGELREVTQGAIVAMVPTSPDGEAAKSSDKHARKTEAKHRKSADTGIIPTLRG